MNAPATESFRRRRFWQRCFAWLFGAVAMAAVAVSLFPGLLRRPSASLQRQSETAAASEAPPVTITSEVVSTRSVQRTVNVVGTLYGYEEVVISANVDGRIVRRFADVGDRVKPNAQLAQIDPVNYQLTVDQAQRSLDVELARLGLREIPGGDFDIEQLPSVRETLSRLTLAARTEARTRELSQAMAVAGQDLETAVSNSQTAQAEFENQLLLARAALATINLRQEALQIAEQQLADTVVRAPLPGQAIPFSGGDDLYAVSSRGFSEGTYVRAGSEVFRLVIDNALRLRVSVPERNLASIQLGQNAEVTTLAFPEPFGGKVSMINPAITPETRTFEVEILIDNSGHRLKPGGFAKARIITRHDDTATTVPLESLVSFAGISKVFLVEKGRCREVPVTVGEQGIDWIEIVAPPLSAGARVVTSGQTALSNESPVVERDIAAAKRAPGDDPSAGTGRLPSGDVPSASRGALTR
jgi:RND family efflux transporter MFP subunit